MSQFLSLPPEIRVNEIFSYLLPAPGDLDVLTPWGTKFTKSKSEHNSPSAKGDDPDAEN